MMAAGTCGECRHWGSMTHDVESGEYIAPCRARPPVFVFGVKLGCWPVTGMYDRCGEYTLPTPPEPDPNHTGKPDCTCANCIPF